MAVETDDDADPHPATSVLEASALLAPLHGEDGAEAVGEAIADGAAISLVNLAEVLSKLADAGKDPRQARRELGETAGESGALVVEPLTEEDCIEAARMRPLTRQLGLSLGDRVCLALARRLGLPAVTADRAWGRLDESDLEVSLIR